jgi:hypothetical protein
MRHTFLLHRGYFPLALMHVILIAIVTIAMVTTMPTSSFPV